MSGAINHCRRLAVTASRVTVEFKSGCASSFVEVKRGACVSVIRVKPSLTCVLGVVLRKLVDHRR